MQYPKEIDAICLIGPTATGKTDMAVRLAESFPFRIISVDSALIYRDMNIGTAKPDRQTLGRAPHRLIDIRNPDETYSVAQFCEDAKYEIENARRQGLIPLLVGGTMMYFHTLMQGITRLPQSCPNIRQRLQDEMAQSGSELLHRRLQKVDPVAAGSIHPNDPQRILRALEVYEQTGIPLSQLHRSGAAESPVRMLRLALMPENRATLHEAIAQRFDRMLKNGLVDELESLKKRYTLHFELPSMRCVGYRQAWLYLEGKLDKSTLREKGIVATRQLAKRQMTWIRNSQKTVLIEAGLEHPQSTYQEILHHIEGYTG